MFWWNVSSCSYLWEKEEPSEMKDGGKDPFHLWEGKLNSLVSRHYHSAELLQWKFPLPFTRQGSIQPPELSFSNFCLLNNCKNHLTIFFLEKQTDKQTTTPKWILAQHSIKFVWKWGGFASTWHNGISLSISISWVNVWTSETFKFQNMNLIRNFASQQLSSTKYNKNINFLFFYFPLEANPKCEITWNLFSHLYFTMFYFKDKQQKIIHYSNQTLYCKFTFSPF